MLQKTIYIETYGCTANQNNSEILAGLLSSAGFIVTNNLEIAEIIILNTCIVKSKTESKIKRRIQDLTKENPKKLLVIIGCMPQADAKKLKKICPKAILLGARNFKDIINILKDYYENQLTEKKQLEYLSKNQEIKLNLPKKPANSIVSITQISEGCLGDCSYCRVRLAKGKLFSYSQEEILKSIESDLSNGAKEVWLTSQDNSSYGLDSKEAKHKLPELLKKILELKHKFKLRLGMMNPNNVLPILENLIEIYKDKKMFKFIHIPIQSASNKILKDMNRFYKIEQVESIIKEFRKNFPSITIATDIIVGYPDETEEDHKANIKFIEEFAPECLNLSKFSSHKQTRAGKLKPLAGNLIKRRARELMQVHRKTATLSKKQFIGKTIKVLVDSRVAGSENLYKARDENYNLVILKCSKEDFAKEVDVKINSASVYSLVGEKTK